MVHCISVNIVTDNQTIIDTIKSKVKTKVNSKLWQGDLAWRKDTYTDDNGHLRLRGDVRYTNEADMNITLNWMKTNAATYKPQLIGPEGEEQGSFIEAHTCDHRKSVDGTLTPGDKCTITYRWDK